MNHVVKRKGHTESFDERKMYASIYAACLSAQLSDEESESIAEMITHDIKHEVMSHKELNAHALHDAITKHLKKYNMDASYMFNTHKDLS